MRELEQGRKSAPVKTAVKKDVKTEKEKAKETAKEKETAKAKRPSAGGALPVCPVSKKCGGCQLLHIPYEKQLVQKRKELNRLLAGIHTVDHPVIGMENPYHYRNKVHAVFDHDRKGNPISGVYKEGTHEVVPVESCLIENQKADEIIATIRGMLKSFKIRTYDEDTGYGLLRHVLIRCGAATGQIMVVLVTSSPVFPSRNNFVKALREKHPEITTVVQNINGKDTSMVLGEREQVLYGKGYIEDELCGLRFRISPKSFYQVNSVQTEKLYGKAMELAGLRGTETVIDAYCGIGTIGLVASRRAKQVIGVELNRDAVRDAVNNAKLNGIKNARFCCGDAGEFMAAMAARGETADVVFMDPPRSGSTKEFIDSVAKMGPGRVVYVSCGPETLARDLRYFMRKGYAVEDVWGVDMFGFTGHCETVVLLSKLNTKQHIEVELNLDKLDLTAAESKATYDEIKAYVLEKYGLKVSSLYISQVKRKCGLDMGQNYNLSKKEDAKVPQCPPEKEAAIVEALKHFHMI